MIRIIPLAVLLAPAIAFAQSASTTSHPASPPPASSSPSQPAGNSPAAAGTSDTGGSPAHYTSMSDATSKCSGDTVVWANPTSKALHVSGDRYFGKSKRGFYACEKDAMAAGYHMSGHRKHKKTT